MSISEWLSFISDNELKAELIKEYVKNDWVTGQNQPYVSTNLEEADRSFAHLEGADLTGRNLREG